MNLVLLEQLVRRLQAEIDAGGGGGASLSNATPASVGTATAGVGTAASRDDHVHAHGSQLGGTLHAASTTVAAGFVSAANTIKLAAMPFISATDPAYGAGTGGDDAPKVLAALTAAQAAGIGRVHLPEGTYTFDCQSIADATTLQALIDVPGDNMAITGDGPGRTVINVINATSGVGADSVNLFGVTSLSKVVFDGLHFVGENDPFSYVLNNSGCCIRVYTSEDVVVRNCRFESLWGFSVHDDGSMRVHVMDCTFVDCANGVNVNADWSVQARNVFDQSEGYEASGKHVVIANNTFRRALGNAMSIGGNTSGDEFPGAVVIGNTVDGSTSVGMTVTDGAVAAVIANNTIRGCENGGIVVTRSDPAMPLESCIFTGNVIDSNCISGGSSAVGMDIRDGSKHLVYANISVDRGVVGYEQKYGLKLDAPNCVVSGNYFKGTTKDASFDVHALETTEELNVFVNKNEEWLGTRNPKRNSYNDNTVAMFLNRVWNSSAGDAYAMFAQYPNGKFEWGPDTAAGVGLRDTNLYRSAADTLKTDDAFVAASLTTGGAVAATGTVTGSNLSGTNTGDQSVTIGTFGAAPDAKAATASGTAVTIQPADATHPGAVSLGAQTLGSGTKTADALVASVDVTANSTTAGQNGQFHAKNNQTDSFATYRCYNSSGTAKFALGYGNSATVSPYTSTAYINAASGETLKIITGTTTNATVATSGVWDFVSNPTVGSVALLNQTNSVASITNKTFSSMTHGGTLALGSSTVTGSWSFSGSPTIGGTVTLSGTVTFSSAATFGAANTYKGATSLTAHAGGGQASALALTAEQNYVTVCATNLDSVKLPTAALGLQIIVFNLGAASCDVFPASGGAIDALGSNNAFNIAAGASKRFCGQSSTQWRSI